MSKVFLEPTVVNNTSIGGNYSCLHISRDETNIISFSHTGIHRFQMSANSMLSVNFVPKSSLTDHLYLSTNLAISPGNMLFPCQGRFRRSLSMGRMLARRKMSTPWRVEAQGAVVGRAGTKRRRRRVWRFCRLARWLRRRLHYGGLFGVIERRPFEWGSGFTVLTERKQGTLGSLISFHNSVDIRVLFESGAHGVVLL